MASSVQSLFGSFYRLLGENPTITGRDLTLLVNQLFSYQNGLTAYATGGNTNATQITSSFAEFTAATPSTTSTVTASAALPAALPGANVVVINDHTSPMQVFGQFANPNNSNSTDLIAAHNVSSYLSSGVTISAGSVAEFYCFQLGRWKESATG